ncbi:MAG: archease [Candidatus Heimdallarchaeota archaeon]|nr:archease [Candidatus Heimdallarchaeota archaeon]MCK4770910.1 archease [Candidatus Heimdallarchaeota archaeon]
MFKYNILTEEVKSDFAFEVYSDTLSELFRGAGIAMMEAMVEVSKIVIKRTWNIEVKSESLELLLYDFLSELVYLKDVDVALFKDYEIEINENKEYSLSCKAHGAEIDYENDVLLTDVKAVTMYKFLVEEREKDWYCHIILDL